MMDVLEATRNVTEPAMQCRYAVNKRYLGLVQRGGLPPHLSVAAHHQHHLRQRSPLAVSGQRLSRLQCSKGVETLLS